MRKLSNWLLGAWISFCSLLQLWPDAMMHVWVMIPDDLKAALPPIAVKAISYSILLLSMLGKMHAMNKANKRLKDESKNA